MFMRRPIGTLINVNTSFILERKRVVKFTMEHLNKRNPWAKDSSSQICSENYPYDNTAESGAFHNAK